MPPHRKSALLILTWLALLPTPAPAQELEQVRGFTATATLRYRATFANMLGSAPGFVTYNYRVRIADGIAQATVSRDVEADTSMGPGLGSASHSFTGAIGRPGQSNYGQYLWSFSSGTLTLLNTSETGGFRFTVRFYQDRRGIMCSAAAPYVGDNATNLSRLAFRGQVIIADMQQIDSYCAVGAS